RPSSAAKTPTATPALPNAANGGTATPSGPSTNGNGSHNGSPPNGRATFQSHRQRSQRRGHLHRNQSPIHRSRLGARPCGNDGHRNPQIRQHRKNEPNNTAINP